MRNLFQSQLTEYNPDGNIVSYTVNGDLTADAGNIFLTGFGWEPVTLVDLTVGNHIIAGQFLSEGFTIKVTRNGETISNVYYREETGGNPYDP